MVWSITFYFNLLGNKYVLSNISVIYVPNKISFYIVWWKLRHFHSWYPLEVNPMKLFERLINFIHIQSYCMCFNCTNVLFLLISGHRKVWFGHSKTDPSSPWYWHCVCPCPEEAASDGWCPGLLHFSSWLYWHSWQLRQSYICCYCQNLCILDTWFVERYPTYQVALLWIQSLKG